ncbi:hypothetical protein [Amycolatopsis nigrescens]|uniref:hypothetical protein n=1 Tax=Amycolatopsis nigrescens TaxID=381445 RepID=UPI0012FB2307|nr:hypothetical protein [Amycolatopsis nigrescens]
MDAVVEVLENAKDKIAKTAEENTAFTGGENPGDLFARVAPRFDDVRFYLGRILLDNMENLRLCSKALEEIACRYDEQEGAGAGTFGRLPS